MNLKQISNSGGIVLHRDESSAAPLAPFTLKKILVPLDFSDCSERALGYAIPLARLCHAELVLLHVVEPYPQMPEVALIDHETADEATRRLQASQEAVSKWLKSSLLVRCGQPAETIKEAARELAVDLIVIATHGRSGLARMFLGSTAERVVRSATCPVLVVRGQSPTVPRNPAEPALETTEQCEGASI